MTVGEKIQQLRKQNQLSQEELGQQLFVSRQTVSLWENGQTLPTIDNLMRLKEIFGVSIDSILCEESPSAQPIAQSNGVSPFESYRFPLEHKDFKFIYIIRNSKSLKTATAWLFALLFSICLYSIDTPKEDDAVLIVLLPLMFFCIAVLKCIIKFLNTKNYVSLLCSKNYQYETYQHYMLVSFFNNEDKIRTEKLYYGEFIKCWETPVCLILQTKDKRLFFIKKSFLDPNSYIFYLGSRLKTGKTDFSNSKITLLKTAGRILFVGCFLGFFLAMAFIFDEIAKNQEQAMESIKHMSIFHWFLPIPILSIIVGILLNKHKIRNIKNIVCGILIGIMMLVYGSFPTLIGNVNVNIEHIETQIGFEFPQYEGLRYDVSTNLSGKHQTLTQLSFSDSTSKEFENFMSSDKRWLSESDTDFSEVMPENLANIPTDYFLFYNASSDEFSQLPRSDGEYDLIFIIYSSYYKVAYIYEYTVDYKS